MVRICKITKSCFLLTQWEKFVQTGRAAEEMWKAWLHRSEVSWTHSWVWIDTQQTTLLWLAKSPSGLLVEPLTGLKSFLCISHASWVNLMLYQILRILTHRNQKSYEGIQLDTAPLIMTPEHKTPRQAGQWLHLTTSGLPPRKTMSLLCIYMSVLKISFSNTKHEQGWKSTTAGWSGKYPGGTWDRWCIWKGLTNNYSWSDLTDHSAPVQTS